jgi:hypothetical protein
VKSKKFQLELYLQEKIANMGAACTQYGVLYVKHIDNFLESSIRNMPQKIPGVFTRSIIVHKIC